MNNYDPTKASKYIHYLQENNLYRWAMSGYLPCDGFKWLKNAGNFDVNLTSENSETGYILDVDLQYPEELHTLHNDYPLALEKLAVQYDM